MNDNTDWLNATAIAIVGHRGSGKTALAYSLLDTVKDRPVFVFNHPRPELLAERGWNHMRRLEQLYEVENSICLIDEPQIVIPKLDKRANDGLQKLLSIARHRDLTLMFSTCDSRWITRALESFIDVWAVKDLEPRLLKQGSLVKKVIQNHVVCDPDEFKLEKNQFLAYARDYPEIDGLHTFDLPAWWDMRWSKPFALKKGDETATNLRQVAMG